MTVLRNEMSEGYASHALFGINTGVKSWALNFDRGLSGAAVRTAWLTDPDGATVSTIQYLRNLYKKNRVYGVPFVYADPNNNGQYYLVDFVPEPLSSKRKRGINIFESGVQFQQRRINGVTVFDPSLTWDAQTKTTTFSWYKGANFSGATWTASSGNNFTATGDVAKVSAAQNGHDVVRFQGSASTGYIQKTGGTFQEAFIVMKAREATWSSNGGVLTGSTGGVVLLASSGTTKFANQSVGGSYQYRLNGETYAESNQQAPMNTWGIVHVRDTTSGFFLTPNLMQIGKDRTNSAFAKVDIGEIIVNTAAQPVNVAREITEYLAVKWDITLP